MNSRQASLRPGTLAAERAVFEAHQRMRTTARERRAEPDAAALPMAAGAPCSAARLSAITLTAGRQQLLAVAASLALAVALGAMRAAAARSG